MTQIDRRSFFSLGAKVVASTLLVPELNAATLWQESPSTVAQSALDAFILRYMQAMNAPGMALGIANKSGVVKAAAYGFSNIDTREPVAPEQLFQIGSLTKSFIALMLLQMREEGKLDLNRDVKSYLPWLPLRTSFGPVTAHGLLTHSSGLPDPLRLFPSDPSIVWQQGYRPGSHFYYSNLGFAILGELIALLDGRPWTQSVQKRILGPLGMRTTTAVYDSMTRARSPQSYVPFFGDRTFPAQGRLVAAAQSIFEDSAGSICSTSADMARYMQMLLNRGVGPNGRIVSEESFAMMTTPHIKAEEFSPTASYGYGIALDTLDGHNILRHTGGTNSYMTAVQIDMDAGFGIFSSINAQLGYRPNPVAQYGLRVLRAEQEGKPAPDAPGLSDPLTIKDAGQYAGIYQSPNGNKIEIIASGGRLTWNAAGRSLPIQMTTAGEFVIVEPDFDRFPIVFGRENGKPEGAVVEIGHGADWYPNERYKGPRTFTYPAAWNALIGYYRNDDAWGGSVRIVVRKGKLLLNGVVALEPEPDSGTVFRLADPPYNPERAEFLFVAAGKARVLRLQGTESWREEIE